MDYTNEIIDVLRVVAGREDILRLEEGLSEAELGRAEELGGFRFPPDWREVLSEVSVVDQVGVERQQFPDWRSVASIDVQSWMNWPFETLLFDVERNRFRLPGWSKLPQPGEDYQAMLRATLDAVPRLIPLYAHRFLPAMPYESGNPVFSMYGADTIVYGSDLLSYFCNEFTVSDPRAKEPPLKRIPFWSPLAGGE